MDLDSSPHVIFPVPGIEIPADLSIKKEDLEGSLYDTLARKTDALRTRQSFPARRGFDQLHEHVAALAAESESILGQLGGSNRKTAAMRGIGLRSNQPSFKSSSSGHGRRKVSNAGVSTGRVKVSKGKRLTLNVAVDPNPVIEDVDAVADSADDSQRTFITEVEPSKLRSSLSLAPSSPSRALSHSASRGKLLAAGGIGGTNREMAAIVYRDELVSRSKAGRLESAFFPGTKAISNLEYLPGGVEIKSFVNRVEAPSSIAREMIQRKETWTKMIDSRQHRHLIRDAFWWFYLQHFRSKARGGVGMGDNDSKATIQSKEALFGRMSENFVELLLSLDRRHRHHCFDEYGDTLAQSVFSAYACTFPKSSAQFTDHFCSDLASTVQEWVSGFKPHNPKPNWPVERLSHPLGHRFRRVDHGIAHSPSTSASVTSSLAVRGRGENLLDDGEGEGDGLDARFDLDGGNGGGGGSGSGNLDRHKSEMELQLQASLSIPVPSTSTLSPSPSPSPKHRRMKLKSKSMMVVPNPVPVPPLNLKKMKNALTLSGNRNLGEREQSQDSPMRLGTSVAMASDGNSNVNTNANFGDESNSNYTSKSKSKSRSARSRGRSKLPPVPQAVPVPRKTHPSIVAGRTPRRDKSVMDIFGTSPFVSYYLASRGIGRANPKPFFLRRTDNNVEQVDRMKRGSITSRANVSSGNSPGNLTYRDIRRASNWTQKQLNDRYKRSLVNLERSRRGTGGKSRLKVSEDETIAAGVLAVDGTDGDGAAGAVTARF